MRQFIKIFVWCVVTTIALLWFMCCCAPLVVALIDVVLYILDYGTIIRWTPEKILLASVMSPFLSMHTGFLIRKANEL